MNKQDIFGKKYYKKENLKHSKRNIYTHTLPKISHEGLIAIKGDMNVVTFLALLYQQTAYLFEVAEQKFQIEIPYNTFSYKVFTYIDNQTSKIISCICNYSQSADGYPLIAETDAVFLLNGIKKKKLNQMSLMFDFEDKSSLLEDNSLVKSYEKAWVMFWKVLSENAFQTLPKIDFIIPVSIKNYAIAKAMLLHLSKLPNISYKLISHAELHEFKEFFTLVEIYEESIRMKNNGFFPKIVL
jgi:hypothetical protein